jgi:nicotinate-nucleotide adenylyltransferase
MHGIRAAIMGGAFDPIHNGHLVIAEEARQAFNLDEVIFIPNNQSPFNKQQLAPAHHRIAMIRAAIAGNPNFTISTAETDRTGRSYAIDTIATVRAQRTDIGELFFITGADAILAINMWKDFEKLLEQCRFIAATRPGFDLESITEILDDDLAARVSFMSATAMEISSSGIRQRRAQGKSIRYLTPEAVVEYIEEFGLYV